MRIQVTTTTKKEKWSHSAGITSSNGKVDLALGECAGEEWEGWGGCFNELGWIALSELPEEKRAMILDELFAPGKGCNFTFCRLPIGANDYAAEWYSHNENADDFSMEKFSIERDHKYLLPFIKEGIARQPEMKLFASPWSPPTWFKFPRAHNYGTMIWKPEYLNAYALYFAKFVEAYGKEGIHIDQVHVQNEPVADQKFPSCFWTGAQMRDFIRDHLGPEFKKRGLDCAIWLGTLNTDDYDGYVNTTFTDPVAYEFTAGVGLQWAGKGMAERVHAAWPEKGLMQTENECGDGENTWEYAHYVFNLIRHYLTNGATAYTYWNMALAPTGLSTWGWHQNSMITVDPQKREAILNPEFYVLKHFSHFILPGAKRLQLSGCLAANAVAFRNTDGSKIAVVANPLKQDRKCTLQTAEGLVELNLPAESFCTVALA